MNFLFWVARFRSWRTGPFELNFALMGIYIALILYSVRNVAGLDGWLNRARFVKQNRILEAVLG